MSTILSIDDRLTLDAMHPDIPFHYIAKLVVVGEQMVMPKTGWPERSDHMMVFRMAVITFVNWRLAVRGGVLWLALRDQFDCLRRTCREIDHGQV